MCRCRRLCSPHSEGSLPVEIPNSIWTGSVFKIGKRAKLTSAQAAAVLVALRLKGVRVSVS